MLNRVFILLFLSLVWVSGSLAHSGSSPCAAALTRGAVIIVDAYSSGNLLAPELLRQGYFPIHIHSHGTPLDFQLASYRPQDFAREIAYAGDLPALIAEVSRYSPLAIMPGAESGVLLADELSAALHTPFGVPSNGVSHARRDKALMTETLKAAGLNTVQQLRSRSIKEILEWAKDLHLLPERNQPGPGVVLKPVASSGSQGVSYSGSEQELHDHFAELYGKKDKYDQINDTVLAQERLYGPEWVGNAVFSQGKVVFTDLWGYRKREIPGAGEMYDHDRLLPFEGEQQAQLVEYVTRAAAALGLVTGWAHPEVRMTSRGPVMIDFGARMMGAGQPQLVTAALGRGQVEVGIDAYLHPGKFLHYPLGYTLSKHAALMTIISKVGGMHASHRLEAAIQALPGYHRHKFSYAQGEPVPRTIDMDTAVAQIELVHPDPVVLEQSIATVHQWEEDGEFLQP